MPIQPIWTLVCELSHNFDNFGNNHLRAPMPMLFLTPLHFLEGWIHAIEGFPWVSWESKYSFVSKAPFIVVNFFILGKTCFQAGFTRFFIRLRNFANGWCNTECSSFWMLCWVVISLPSSHHNLQCNPKGGPLFAKVRKNRATGPKRGVYKLRFWLQLMSLQMVV